MQSVCRLSYIIDVSTAEAKIDRQILEEQFSQLQLLIIYFQICTWPGIELPTLQYRLSALTLWLHVPCNLERLFLRSAAPNVSHLAQTNGLDHL